MSAWHFCKNCSRAAFALLEAVIAAGLLALVAVGSMQALAVLNRRAAADRLYVNSRSVVQRNMDTALSLAFNSGTTPAILAITGTSGVVYDDDGGTPTTIAVALQGNAGVTLVSGTLTRIVTAVSNSDNADIRQVTFRIDYTYGSRPYSYQLTTMRAIDD